jgi:hypothetical protein
MNDFLQFLNTASADSLTKIPGISLSLAESLVASRPFDSIEDCLKVRGMGKNLLARAQASFEKAEAEIVPEERALIPAEQEEQEDAQIEKVLSVKETPPASKPSFSSRLGQALLWFFRALVRLILIALVIGGIGAGIYYGAPLINNRFIAPVEQNAERVRELETEIAALQTQSGAANNQMTAVNGQLTEINEQLVANNGRLDALEQSVEAHTTTLATLADMQATLEAELKTGNDQTLLALKHEVMLARVLDTLARARLYLAQSNFSLAKADVQSAHDLLAELQSEAEDEAFSQALERLELTLGNLPEFPVVASGDLEIAWQILMTGKPVATATPMPESTPTQTATPQAPPPATSTP